MKVKYKNGSMYTDLTEFPYKEGDYVTIVVRYWTAEEDEDNIYYHGYITGIDEQQQVFWARLEHKPKEDELFHFSDIEAVIDGDKIPFLARWKKRVRKRSAE